VENLPPTESKNPQALPAPALLLFFCVMFFAHPAAAHCLLPPTHDALQGTKSKELHPAHIKKLATKKQPKAILT